MTVVVIHDFAERAVGGDEIETLIVGVGFQNLVSHTIALARIGEQAVAGSEHGKDGIGLGFYQTVCREKQLLRFSLFSAWHEEGDGQEENGWKKMAEPDVWSVHGLWGI